MSTLLLEIVTPERIVYSKNINMVSVKGVSGELGILPHHIPLVTPLKIAPVKAKIDGAEEYIAVNGGFIEVRKDKVVILAESAELPSEIDVHRAEAARDRAKERIDSHADHVDFRRAEIALQRAMNRLNTAKYQS